MPRPSIPTPVLDRTPVVGEPAAIIARESMPAARRFGIVTVLGLLAGGVVFTGAPLAAGAVRVAGMSLAWWYAVVASIVAAAVTAIVLSTRAAASADPTA